MTEEERGNVMKKKELRERLRERYGAGAILPDRDTVVLQGGRRVTVHGCRRILQYSPIEIRVSLGREALSIEGEQLYCDSFGSGCVTVRGDVRRVSYLPVEDER